MKLVRMACLPALVVSAVLGVSVGAAYAHEDHDHGPITPVYPTAVPTAEPLDGSADSAEYPVITAAPDGNESSFGISVNPLAAEAVPEADAAAADPADPVQDPAGASTQAVDASTAPPLAFTGSASALLAAIGFSLVGVGSLGLALRRQHLA